jgi:DNA-binding transcriptional LysR family regulator
VADQTRLRIITDALSGTWEALLDHQVDLLIGAAGEGPSGGGYTAEPIGKVRFIFTVAPSHPLANITHALGKDDLHDHRAVTVSDSGRRLPARTVGVLFGQDTLTVSDMRTKYELQVGGLGFGFLPDYYAQEAINAGLLIEKKVKEPKPDETLFMAWRTGEEGAALNWWMERMREQKPLERLLSQTLHKRK